MNFLLHKDPVQPLPLAGIDSVDRIATCNWHLNPEEWGIANNAIVKVYNHCDNIKVIAGNGRSGRLKIAYVSDRGTYNELHYLLKAISLFNEINSADLTIYCDQQHLAILRPFSNEHISFAGLNEYTDQKGTLVADVIVTYGTASIHFIKQAIPVLIAGPYGLGGWVTPANLPYLFRDGFVGRPGGTLGEYIPPKLFAKEILSITACSDLVAVTAANKEYVEGLAPHSLADVDTVFGEYTSLMQCLEHTDKRWLLCPKVASNILVEYAEESIMLKRRYINDCMCMISKEDMPFFRTINGSNTCRYIYEHAALSEDEFWETIQLLTEKKIIFL